MYLAEAYEGAIRRRNQNDVHLYDDGGGAFEFNDNGGNDATATQFVAKALGYLVGIMSLLLYTPIAVRVSLQKHADGLVMSTWWLKLTSYLLSDTYYIRQRYDLSTYAETLIITIESVVVLVLVVCYQNRTREALVWTMAFALAIGVTYLATIAPGELVAIGQLSSVAINTAALVPQCLHNAKTRSKGDYSPLTASLASMGCAARLFTTVTLNGSDPVLLVTFGVAFSANLGLLLQILYFGTRVEGLTIRAVFMADVGAATSYGTVAQESDHGSECLDGEFETAVGSQGALRRRPMFELSEVDHERTCTIMASDGNAGDPANVSAGTRATVVAGDPSPGVL